LERPLTSSKLDGWGGFGKVFDLFEDGQLGKLLVRPWTSSRFDSWGSFGKAIDLFEVRQLWRL